MDIRDGKADSAAPGPAVIESHDVGHWNENEDGSAHFFVLDIVPSEG
ncbi:hypothetical protein TRM7557_03346 [Tritonibacter multivorans]|uniref:Cupin domain protein n=1 Tax=Tritonibacter multivorans TaxID=928856 RepID=A0A0P1GHQ2_9RHOB|nr:hypothetical protein [Tritonibacter multivorans]MDA7420596.1 hypothetical protein [Tritonibacter multivorans]CUH81304.1 hypothetical protein TRM7557_03346 [Tritonibacter multivorans]SFC32562.1 hypothetical protein SAMN04488049_102182 [Tritonibacter multivorans]